MTRPIDTDRRDPIVERARALPDSISPPHDLWPDIRHNLKSQAKTRWSTRRLAAAAVVLIGLSSTFTLWVAQNFEEPVRIEIAATPPVARFGPWFASGTDIVQTRDDMLNTVKLELANLSPETWEILVTNLNNIEAARRDINKALDGHPHSELLQHLLLSTYTNELTLLTQIGSMTRSAQQRIEL